MLNEKNGCKVLGLITAAMLGVASFTAVAADSTSSDMRTPTAGSSSNSSEGSNVPSDLSSGSGSSMPATSGTDSLPRTDKGNADGTAANQGSHSNRDSRASSSRAAYRGSNTATDESGWLAERQISQSDGAPAGTVLLPSFYNAQ